MIAEVRGLSIKDGRYLSNDDLYRNNEIEGHLISACCKVTEPGFYKLDERGKFDWDSLLIGDSLALMISIRQATYPKDPYTIPMKCPVKACREPFDWEVDLDRFMRERMRALPDETKELLSKGQRCTVTIPGTDRTIKFRPKSRKDRRAWVEWRNKMKSGTSKQRERFNEITHSLLYWNAEISGIEREDMNAKLDFLESLSLSQGQELRLAMEAVDCGVETEIETRCPSCGFEQTIELPFGRTFFEPPRKKKDDTETTTAAGAAPTSESRALTTETTEPDPLALG